MSDRTMEESFAFVREGINEIARRLEVRTRERDAIIKENAELRAACRVCDTTITELIGATADTESLAWVNIRAARHLARKAVKEAGR